jgi:hypothetical protein
MSTVPWFHQFAKKFTFITKGWQDFFGSVYQLIRPPMFRGESEEELEEEWEELELEDEEEEEWEIIVEKTGSEEEKEEEPEETGTEEEDEEEPYEW